MSFRPLNYPTSRFYEQGRGIEGEFIGSWCSVERFYQSVQADPFALPVLNLISQLRAAGYERTLRAGTSLFSLVLSRSRRHGLRRGQAFIAFFFSGARFIDSVIAPVRWKWLCPSTKTTAGSPSQASK